MAQYNQDKSLGDFKWIENHGSSKNDERRTENHTSANLKKLLDLGDTPDYVGIAYDWIVDSKSISLKVSSVIVRDNYPELDSKEFLFQLDSKKQNNRIEKFRPDTLGLLSRLPINHSTEIYETFERNVADIIIKYVYKFLDKVDVLIMQGPMLPKLMKWLGGAYLNNKKNIAAITFHNYLNFEPGELGRNDNLDEVYISSLENIPIEINKAKVDDQQVYLEVFCQFPYFENNFVWRDKKDGIRRLFKLPGLTVINSGEVWLPFYLAVAWQECDQKGLTIKEIERIDPVLKIFERDLESLKHLNSFEIVYIRSLAKLYSGGILKLGKKTQKIHNEIESQIEAIQEKEGIHVRGRRVKPNLILEQFSKEGRLDFWGKLRNIK